MKKFVILFSGLFLFGCTAFNNMTGNAYAPKTSDWVVQNTKVKEDSFRQTKRITFPSIVARHLSNYKDITGLSAWDAPTSPYWVSVIQKPNMKDTYVIYMNIDRNDWGFYDEARAENGNKLTFISIDQQVNTGNSSATVSEFFGIQIDEAFLEKNKGRNPQIKVFGKRDSFVIFLPDYYIDGILQYMHQ